MSHPNCLHRNVSEPGTNNSNQAEGNESNVALTNASDERSKIGLCYNLVEVADPKRMKAYFFIDTLSDTSYVTVMQTLCLHNRTKAEAVSISTVTGTKETKKGFVERLWFRSVDTLDEPWLKVERLCHVSRLPLGKRDMIFREELSWEFLEQLKNEIPSDI
jgi:hypothetical protein